MAIRQQIQYEKELKQRNQQTDKEADDFSHIIVIDERGNSKELSPKERIDSYSNLKHKQASELVSETIKNHTEITNPTTRHLLTKAYQQLIIINEETQQRLNETRNQIENDDKEALANRRSNEIVYDVNYKDRAGNEISETIGIRKVPSQNENDKGEIHYFKDSYENGHWARHDISEGQFYEIWGIKHRNDVKDQMGICENLWEVVDKEGNKLVIRDASDPGERNANTLDDGFAEVNFYRTYSDGRPDKQLSAEELEEQVDNSGMNNRNVDNKSIDKLDKIKKAKKAYDEFQKVQDKLGQEAELGTSL